MIDINRETGAVTWDNFTLHPHLTHDEFVQQYPTIELRGSHYVIGGKYFKDYQFSKVVIGDNVLIPNVVYENNNLSIVSFKADELLYNKYQSDRTMSVRQLYDISADLRKLLVTHLGQPHKYQDIFGADYNDDEKKLNTDDIPFTQGWSYAFEWGDAGSSCYYEGRTIHVSIGVSYNPFYQINTWEKLAEECDICIRNEQEQTGYVADLLAMRLLIDMLSPHFDFWKLRPYFHLGGITFLKSPLERRPRIEVRPNDIEKKYKISRPDTTKTSFIAEGDNSRLIDELRLFLEAETL